MMEKAYEELEGVIQADHLDLVECMLKLECAYRKSGDSQKVGPVPTELWPSLH